MKKNRFETLNDALNSESLIEYWPLGLNIEYDSTISIIIELGNNKYKSISITRFNNGFYERPIHYFC